MNKPTPTMINDINTKITKVFNNPNITFFIIMCLILLISCYTFINTPLRYTISSFISNPFIILFVLIFVIILGFYNINIAILLLLLLFVSLFGATIFNSNNMNGNNTRNRNSIENFTDGTNEEDQSDDDEEDDNDEEEIDRFTPKNNKKSNSEKIKEAEEEQDGKIDSIKNVLLGTVNKLKEGPKNELQKGILENKLTIYKKEKQNNNSKNSNSRSKFTNISNSKSKGKGKSKNNKGEGFHTVKTRTFDPTKEDDTNLLITKEVLQDMINRIEYDFENSKYLKKYLKHRIEEIVEMNKLLEDDD